MPNLQEINTALRIVENKFPENTELMELAGNIREKYNLGALAYKLGRRPTYEEYQAEFARTRPHRLEQTGLQPEVAAGEEIAQPAGNGASVGGAQAAGLVWDKQRGAYYDTVKQEYLPPIPRIEGMDFEQLRTVAEPVSTKKPLIAQKGWERRHDESILKAPAPEEIRANIHVPIEYGLGKEIEARFDIEPTPEMREEAKKVFNPISPAFEEATAIVGTGLWNYANMYYGGLPKMLLYSGLLGDKEEYKKAFEKAAPESELGGLISGIGGLAGFIKGYPLKIGRSIANAIPKEWYRKALMAEGGTLMADISERTVKMGIEFAIAGALTFQDGENIQDELKRRCDAAIHGLYMGMGFGALSKIQPWTIQTLATMTYMGLPPALRGATTEEIVYEILIGAYFGYKGGKAGKQAIVAEKYYTELPPAERALIEKTKGLSNDYFMLDAQYQAARQRGDQTAMEHYKAELAKLSEQFNIAVIDMEKYRAGEGKAIEAEVKPTEAPPAEEGKPVTEEIAKPAEVVEKPVVEAKPGEVLTSAKMAENLTGAQVERLDAKVAEKGSLAEVEKSYKPTTDEGRYAIQKAKELYGEGVPVEVTPEIPTEQPQKPAVALIPGEAAITPPAVKEPWEMTKKDFRNIYKENELWKLNDELIVKEVGSSDPQKIVEYYRKKHGIQENINIVIGEPEKGIRLMEGGLTKGKLGDMEGIIRISPRWRNPNPGDIRHELEHIFDKLEYWHEAKKTGDYASAVKLVDTQEFHHRYYEKFGADYLHRKEIEKALSEGKPVPPEVLKDYPDLAEKYGKPIEAPKPEEATVTLPAVKEPWEMTRKEYLNNLPENEQYKQNLENRYNELYKIYSKGYKYDNASPAHRIISQDAFEQLKKEYPDIKSFSDIRVTPHESYIYSAFRKGKSIPAEVLADYPDLAKKYNMPLEGAKAEKPIIEAKTQVIPYSKDLIIRNIESLPAGAGTKYLEVVKGEGNEYIAKQWRKKLPPEGIIIDFKPKGEPYAEKAGAEITKTGEQERLEREEAERIRLRGIEKKRVEAPQRKVKPAIEVPTKKQVEEATPANIVKLKANIEKGMKTYIEGYDNKNDYIIKTKLEHIDDNLDVLTLNRMADAQAKRKAGYAETKQDIVNAKRWLDEVEKRNDNKMAELLREHIKDLEDVLKLFEKRIPNIAEYKGSGKEGEAITEEVITPKSEIEKGVVEEIYTIGKNELNTDVKRFQNREKAYSEETVNKIVSDGWGKNPQDPILVWRDPKNDKLYILSGHSRLEAAKRLGIKDVIVRELKVDEKEAIRLAEESNRVSTPETLTEGINLYNKMVERGESQAEIKRKLGRNYDMVKDLSGLNPEGKFMMNLKSGNKDFPYLPRRARSAGQLRSRYPDKLTNAHENQIFDYYYMETKDIRRLLREDLFNLIEDQVSRFDFEPDKPLVIKGGKEIKTGTKARYDTAWIEEQIAKLKERQKIANTPQERQSLQKEIDKLQEGIKEVVRSQVDMFGEEVPSVSADVGGYERREISLVKLPEMVELAKMLNEGRAPSIKKKLRAAKGRALGVAGGTGIKLKADIFATPELAQNVLGHEIGHVINWLPEGTKTRGNIWGHLATLKKYMEKTYKNNLYTNTEIRNELKRLSKLWKPFDDKANLKFTKYRYSSKELYADALSVLLNNPDILRKEAPKFYEAFFKYLNRKPIVLESYNKLMSRIHEGKEAVLQHRMDSVIEMMEVSDKSSVKAEKRNMVKEIWDDIVQGFWDVNTPLIKAMKKVKKEGAYIEPEKDAVIAQQDFVYSEGYFKQYLREMGRDVFKIIKEENVSNAEMGSLLFFRRVATERKDIANPKGIDYEASIEILDKLRNRIGIEKFSKLIQAAENLNDIRQKLIIKLAREEGMYSEELQKYMESNEYYVTYDVIHDMLKNKIGNQNTGHIYKQIGTLSDIENPLYATILKDSKILRSIMLNKAKRKAVEMLEQYSPESIRDAESQWNGKYHDFKEPIDREWALVVYQKKGELIGKYIPKDIGEAVNHRYIESNKLLNGLSIVTSPFKAIYVTKNPFWALMNIQRDVLRATIMLPKANFPKMIKYVLKSIKDAYKDVIKETSTPTVEDMYKNFELIAGRQWKSGDKSIETEFESLVRNFFKNPDHFYQKHVEKNIARFLLKKLEDFGQISERVTKIAVHKYLKENTNLGDREIARIVRNTGSPDFYRRGKYYMFYNNVFMFSNAGKEGIRGMIESREYQDPSKLVKLLFPERLQKTVPLVWKIAKYEIVPKLIMKAFKYGVMSTVVSAIIKQLGDDDKEYANKIIEYTQWLENAYQKIPEYDLTNYKVIPFAEDKNGKVIYAVFPHDFTGQMLAGTMWKMADSIFEGKDFRESLKHMATGLPYESINPVLGILSDSYQYFIKQINPPDNWRNRPLISRRKWEIGGIQRDLEFVKQAWNKYGATFIYRFPYDGLERNISTIEKIFGSPLLGKGLARRFVRISNRGIYEKYGKISEDVSRERAKELQAIDNDIIKHINEIGIPTGDDAYNLWWKMKKDYDVGTYSDFRNRYLKQAIYKIDDVLWKALLHAPSNEARAKIFSEYYNEEYNEEEAKYEWGKIKDNLSPTREQ